ncbi:MAG: hypothetical protein ACOC4K_00135 [Verrucomicrobiota bacterium]
MTQKKNTYRTPSFTRTLGAALTACLLLPALPAFSQMQGQGQGQGQTQNQGQDQNQDQVQERLQELQTELQELNADIQEVQSEANKSEEVRESLKNYSTTLSDQMKEISPDQSDLIDERQDVYNKLLTINDGSEMTPEKQQEMQKLGEKFNTIRQELQTTEAQANQSDVVREALSEYNDKVVQQMEEIDPEITGKIERQQEASKEFSDLRNSILQQ